ncbi:MAG: FmdB family zinc ribbon protein [Balneolaceae bacterium]
MPTYEYRRKDGSVFEYRQGINDEPLKVCPETGQPVNRIISGGGGVVYKGDGWYVTDYKNKSQNGSSPSAAPGTDSSESSEKTDKEVSSNQEEKETGKKKTNPEET